MSNLFARKSAAVAFVAQPLRKGQAWASLPYAYDIEENTMLYLHWYDDNLKKDIATKIADACTAYAHRYGTPPTVALVNEMDAAPASVAGVVTRVERRIGRNNVHVGVEGETPQ